MDLQRFTHKLQRADYQYVMHKRSSAKTLVISYVGMETQELAIKPKMRVLMESSSQALEEVMVVAYGTAKKSAFTGSASTMKAEKIAERQVANVTNA